MHLQKETSSDRFFRYFCEKSRSKNGRGISFNMMDEKSISKNGLCPIGIRLNYPIQLYEQSGCSSTLVRWAFFLHTSRSSDSDIVKAIQCARTAKYVEIAAAWRGHVIH